MSPDAEVETEDCNKRAISFSTAQVLPSGAKAQIHAALDGTAKAVPFRKPKNLELLHIFHRQHRPVIAAVGTDGARDHAAKGGAQFGELAEQRLDYGRVIGEGSGGIAQVT